MPFEAFFFATVGAFAFLHFYLVPRARHAVPRSTGADVLKKAAALALVSALRSIALTLATVTALLGLALWFIPEVAGRSSIAALAIPLTLLQGMRSALGDAEPWLGGLATAYLIWMLVRSARRSTAKRVHARLMLVQQQQIDAILANARDGTLEARAPNAEMRELASQLDSVLATREALEQAVKDEEITTADAEPHREDLQKRQDAIEQEYARIDILRRIELKLDPSDVEDDAGSPSWWTKARDVLMSRGALTTLEGTAGFVRVLLLILLIPSLLVANSRAFGEQAEQRLARFDELRIAGRIEEATTDWQEALSTLPAADDDEPAIADSVVDALARSFEDAVFQTALVGRRIGPAVRATVARRKMLAVAAGSISPPPTSVGERVAAASDGGIDEVLTRTENAPRTPLGRRYREELRVELERSPRLRAKIRTYASSFRQPASSDDIARALLKQTLGYATEGVRPTEQLLGTVYDGIMSSVDPGELRASARELMLQHKIQLARASTLDDVTEWLTRTDNRPAWSSRITRGLNQVVNAHMPDVIFEYEYRPPALTVPPSREVNVARASGVLREVVEADGGASPARSERLTEALVEYDDHFPSGAAATQTTPRGQLLHQLHPTEYAKIDRASFRVDLEDGPVFGGPQRTALEVPAINSTAPRAVRTGRMSPAAIRLASTNAAGSALSSARRARSFTRLRGFSRIGGVLIGREPSSVGAVDVRGLSYRMVGDRVELTLTDRSGRTQTLAPIRASVLHRALLYVADGRPVAVTMVTAAPLAELKILTHPALVDTPLGCTLIELDRFVDTYTGQSGGGPPDARDRAERLVHTLHTLYEATWAHAVVASLTSEAIAGYDREGRSYLERRRDAAVRMLTDPETDSAIAFALALPDSLRTGRYSPVFSAENYYDREITRAAKVCAAEGGNIAAFTRCAQRQVATSSKRDISALLDALPTFEIWSGVRERDFVVDPTLRGLQRQPATSPLQFMLQVAFTSAPLDGNEEGAPFEFPAISAWIDASVRGALRAPSRALHRRILNDAEEFTLAQRFARAALDGDLGAAFPVEDLVALTQATRRAGAATYETPRWNPRPGALEYRLARDIAAVGRVLNGGAADVAMRCALALAAAAERRAITSSRAVCATLTRETYATEIGATPAVQAALTFARSRIQETERALRLRESLGVAHYENRRSACPVP